uniref:Histone-lysine N-methyltransferase ASHH2 n=1 Tax=Cannabis sativa TaxID=3483 RepID=A0A803NLZ9_CANSA
MGLCDNSVIVEEPVCVSLSGHNLCSEILVQSVSDQHSCSKLSHQLITEVCTVKGDMLEGETDSTKVMPLENLSKNNSGDDRGCLNKTDSTKEMPLENLSKNSSGDDRGCLNKNDIGVDVCTLEQGRECSKVNKPQGEDGLGNLVGDCETPIEVPGIPLKLSRDQQVDTTRELIVNGDTLAEHKQNKDAFPLENTSKNDYGDSKAFTNESNSDADVCSTETGGEYFNENKPHIEDGLGNLGGECQVSLDTISVSGLSINCDQQVDTTQVCAVNGTLAGDIENACVLALDNSSENDPGYSRVCSNDNLSEIGVCTNQRGRECLKESCAQGDDVLGNLVHSGVISVTSLPINCDLQVEQTIDKNDKYLSVEVIEDKGNDVAEVNSDLCEQESQLHGCESLESLPQNVVLGNSHKQKEDFESVSVSDLENLSVKIVDSVGSEDDTCNMVSPLQRGGIFSEASCSGEEVSNCDLKKDQNNCVSCILADSSITEAVQMESNHVSLSTSTDSIYKNESPSIFVQQCEQISDGSVDTPPTKQVMEFVEEESDVTLDTKVVGRKMVPNEEIAGILNENSSFMPSKCVLEKSGSFQSSQPLGVVNDDSSGRLDVPDQLGSHMYGPINSSSPVERYSQTDYPGKDDEKIDYVSETKSFDMVSSTSRRNSKKGRSIRKTSTTKTPRKGKTKVPVPSRCIKIAIQGRKKRSCLSKSARSSAWGTLGNVTQLFDNSNQLKLINQGSLKANGGKKSGKQKKKGATIRSQGSKRKSGALNTNIRLKVKMGKDECQSSMTAMVPEVVDTSASCTANGCDIGAELYFESAKVANDVEDDWRKDEIATQFKCLSNNPSDFLNDLESNVVSEMSSKKGGDYFGVSPHMVESSGGAADDRCKDPGTSPDSEVINLTPDARVDFKRHDDFQGAVTSPKDLATPGDLTSNKNAKKKNKLSLGNNIEEEKSLNPSRTVKSKSLKLYVRKQNSNNGVSSSENLISSVRANASSNPSSDMDLLHLSETAAATVFAETFQVESGTKVEIPSNQDTGADLSKLQNGKSSILDAKTKGHKIRKGKFQDADSGIKSFNVSQKAQRRSVGKKNTKEKSVCGNVTCKEESQPETGVHVGDGKMNANSGENVPGLETKANKLPGFTGEQYLPLRNAWVSCDNCHKWRRIPAEDADTIEEIKCTWTCKDNMDKTFADCSIPQEKSNADINAELELSEASGEEDVSGTLVNHEVLECKRPRDPKKTAACVSIRTNQYLHRSRKTQTVDEMMICQCKPPSDGRLGCGDDCLNRVLNIECMQGTCPCRDLCSNQQFQKRKYAKLEKFRCGKKGYGLKLLEDISKGHFLIEYVGEVLDMQSYVSRQKEYALKGHKHFYFMTLNCNEVIDACVKGNKGRFINHSCDPNCQTEKWMVNGEICIGLFALRDIKKGEEVTFDYNYVRVFGAAAKKCYCGSPQCRGYIGGDPLNKEDGSQSGSDEDFPETLMLPEDGDANLMHKASSCNDVIAPVSEGDLDKRDEWDRYTTDPGKLEISTGKEDSMNYSASVVSLVDDALELDLKGKMSLSGEALEISQQREDVTQKLIPSALEKSSSSSHRFNRTSPVEVLNKSLHDGVDANRRSKSCIADDRLLSSKAHPNMKAPHSSNVLKKGKVKSNSPNACKVQMLTKKSQVLHMKPKKAIEGSFASRFDEVEEKLNDLLDDNGGISKRKDAPKFYLKLLYHTAKSGDSVNGEPIQRNRDLSMILDALLKTKSRLVLTDIINNNGLRMLHNIMKQYKADFKKIPILRKLLKVLEYLAVREIINCRHISKDPPCPQMESFTESILSLTEHGDRQVHQIARNFRDRWLRKLGRKVTHIDRDENKTEHSRSSRFSVSQNDWSDCNRFSVSQNDWSDHAGRPSEAFDCVKQPVVASTLVSAGIQEGSSASHTGVCPISGTRTRKRKSRWDQVSWEYPVVTNQDSSSLQHKELNVESKGPESSSLPQTSTEDKDVSGCTNDRYQLHKVDIAHDVKQNTGDDVPPGFSSPITPTMGLSLGPSMVCNLQCPPDTAVGHPQEKFLSRSPVSYGVPLSIIQQFGPPETVGSWVVAPGMPFHPFPPLPPLPRGKKDSSPSENGHCLSINQPAEKQQDGELPPTHTNDSTPSTTGSLSGADILCTDNQHTFKRGREWSQDLGRRYFKQQKWNSIKHGSPGHLKRNDTVSSKGVTNCVSIGDITSELRSTYCSESLGCGVEKAGNNCHQHPENHSQH